MRIGYARVSTQDQNLDLQIDALTKDGCEIIYQEKVSGKDSKRPELEKMIGNLRNGDTVIVWKLDRLGRSLRDLVNMVLEFNSKGVEFVSLQDSINTATVTGRFTFHLFASLAEFERERIIERTMAGISAARARGKKGGRPQGLTLAAKEKAKKAMKLYDAGLSVNEIMSSLSIGSKSTLYKYLRHEGAEISEWKSSLT